METEVIVQKYLVLAWLFDSQNLQITYLKTLKTLVMVHSLGACCRSPDGPVVNLNSQQPPPLLSGSVRAEHLFTFMETLTTKSSTNLVGDNLH
jgi:hypothetical protein